jgi:pimeloyl-ACP methyl ester carboxylesterase
MSMHVVYLHGFASSAASTKAGFFASKLRAHRVTLQTPDLNAPDFSSLTITRMVDQVTSAMDATPPAGPLILIGSSLGAFVAVQVALARPERVTRMILLAPAFDFGGHHTRQLGDRSVEQWKATGSTNVFHYGYGRVLPLGYELYADACGYDCVKAGLPMPIQIVQGRRDTVVDPLSVERWASTRPNVELHMVNDDHQLGRSLDYIWSEMGRFLNLERAA